ncbi:MAG: DoxX family protein [Bryobacterales bacterium]|nr:DoxX family protein [Bryobacterales bacterium]
MSKAKQSKGSIWAGRILTLLVIPPFAAGIMKVMRVPMAVEGFARIGIPAEALAPIGIVELACLVIYLVPPTTVLGAVLLTGYLGGAVLANVIGRSDYIHALVVGIVVWGGAWFRVPEIRQLFPVYKAEGDSTARQVAVPVAGSER